MLVSLGDIRRVSGQFGFPVDKTSLIRRLRREGAFAVRGEVVRGQTGFLFDVTTLPQYLRRAAVAAGGG
jgi:hypothetical protein